METALQTLFDTFRQRAKTEREKGLYFEELICMYLRNEATYKDLYRQVWTYADWAKEQGLDAVDTGIDLVAITHGTNEYHAIQCKFYDAGHRVQKRDIDSFFTASGKHPFTHRIIVTTTNDWSEHAEDALQDQQPPVTKIDLHDLGNSQIDWSRHQPDSAPIFKTKKTLRPHQTKAVEAVAKKFSATDRGKLLMACGTGKTFTSLKIAETVAGRGKKVLFCVPSLALLSQTLTEWTQEAETPLHSFAVCSDSDVGKKRKKHDDTVQTFMHELRYPATVNAKALVDEMAKRHDPTHMSVVFCTYHSIAVIHEAQKHHGIGGFDLIICDEAHRTTGATFSGEDESHFVKVHNNTYIEGEKRIYMTATPRIYGDNAKVTAKRKTTTLCSMDDSSIYGKTLFELSFSEAVEQGLLVDYKVIILTVDTDHISRSLQRLLSENNQLKVSDAAKIIGCWKALGKYGTQEDLSDDLSAMRRAVAFCQVIAPQQSAKTHKISSAQIAEMFREVVEEYKTQEEEDLTLICEAAHIDGSMNATEKDSKLTWLKEDIPEDTCRILSNVRCLSEGVDVPALDAVLFLTPRNSQVDVVQSVGRIMRKAPGKKRGYVILPVVIPTGVNPTEALDDSKTYKVVWDVLQALRSHDDHFDAHINKLELLGNSDKMEVIAITDKLNKKTAGTKNTPTGHDSYAIGQPEPDYKKELQQFIAFEVGEIERALYAKVVQKCGNRNHWEEWAADIATIAKTHTSRIQAIVSNPENTEEAAAFRAFADELRDDLNDSITDEEVIEMLAQHLITKPVFDALFKNYSFATHNPVSKAMQDVLSVLQEHHLDKEADTLEQFYASVRRRAEGIDNAAGKQKIVVELYDKFFRNAFPNMTERLGIVYTPVEVVDFMIHSVNDVLRDEFGHTLGSENVHILDPFTGTGTFITRMLQSGLIKKEQLPHKYHKEMHANEIMLLAYYIAAVNIEAVYHSLMDGDYQPFEGICLTDTFQLHEKDDLISRLMVDNSHRRNRQKKLPIRVIVGNPPYSIGQKSENDNAGNVKYESLDTGIRDSYAAHASATNKNALYDSYIRAIRWGSDQVSNHGEGGVLAYVSNAGWLEGNAMDGLRKCLAEEFSSIYVFHLRGNQRTSGELSRKEGGKIFGSGSRAPIAISLFVKNPNATEHGKIYFHDIGDYLSRDEKLERIVAFKSINGIAAQNGWREITPDTHHDWLNQRDTSFDAFMPLGNKKNTQESALFNNYSRGVATGRDAWCYNPSKQALSGNMARMITCYNEQVTKWQAQGSDDIKAFERFIDTDSHHISWSVNIKNDGRRGRIRTFSDNHIVTSMYRPFIKQHVYFNRHFNERVYQMPRIFPTPKVKNTVIAVTGIGAKEFSVLMVDALPCLDMIEKGQCFPLTLYEKSDVSDSGDLFHQTDTKAGYTVTDGISDDGLARFRAAYPGEVITKEDIFYYVYGILHSPDYRRRYAHNLSKQLPRIPCVATAADFWAFSKAGRALGASHMNYETAKPYAVTLDADDRLLTPEDYRVVKMKFAKKGDKSTVVYNSRITLRDIPPAAYDYVVNGKPALEWVMERQCVKVDKDSGIENDANHYATETVGDSAYPLTLFQRLITVSLETIRIVDELPSLSLREDTTL